MRENFQLRTLDPSPGNLHPYCYYTDAGTYNDDKKYFIHNIFSRSGVCYSTRVPKNANLQLYLGRRVEADPELILPHNHKVKGQANEIMIPYEKYFKEGEEESFKMLRELVIHN